MKLIDADPAELRAKLQTYLENDPLYRTAYDYTKKRFDEAPNLPAHNWAHAYRGTINAIVIGEAEGTDMSIVLPAITMHDIGFLYGGTGGTHGAIGADHLADYLQAGGIAYSPEMIGKIAICIRTHKGSMHNEKPETLEAKVVADADLLDKFGPIGIYQHVRTFTEFNRTLETTISRLSGNIDLTLETVTGQQIADRGRQFVADFHRELLDAAEPYATENLTGHDNS